VDGVADHRVGEVDQPVQASRVSVDDQVIGADVVVDEPQRTVLGRLADLADEIGFSLAQQVRPQ
jgi:hypothetical protein